MLVHVLEVCDLLMVVGLMYCLKCCWQCRAFWAIQAFQLLQSVEIVLKREDFATIYKWEYANLLFSGLAFALARRHFRWASYVLGLFMYLKWLQWLNIDTIDDLLHTPLYWARYTLNIIALYVLLGYAVREAVIRLRRKHVRTRKAEATPYPNPQA